MARVLRGAISVPPVILGSSTWPSCAFNPMMWMHRWRRLRERTPMKRRHQLINSFFFNVSSSCACFLSSSNKYLLHRRDYLRCVGVKLGCFLLFGDTYDWYVVRWGSKNKLHDDTHVSKAFDYIVDCFLTTRHSKGNKHREERCIESENQQTCTFDNQYWSGGGPIFKLG
jgi:hypothetical protein